MVMGKKPYDTNTTSTFELQTKIVTEKLSLTNSSFDGIIGVATEKDVKTWAILVKVYTYFKIKGLSNQLEKLDQSTIDFKVVMPSGMNQIAAFKLQAFPNPANQEIEFTLPQNHTIQSVKLTNILGETKTVSNPIKYQDKQCVLNLQSIAEGAYFVELYSDKGIRFQSKFIKISN
jgi:hypothetical protein